MSFICSFRPLIMQFSSSQGFRDGTFRCLIATDVAARGLDIPSVDLVVKYIFGFRDLHANALKMVRNCGWRPIIYHAACAPIHLVHQPTDMSAFPSCSCEPPNDDTYVHRSGRTGRAGRAGKCITFFKPQQECVCR